MRGRLIKPLFVDIARLDTYETRKDPDGAGPKTKGYDDDFREPVLLSVGTGEGAAIVNRKEAPTIRLPAQIEVEDMAKARMFAGGNAPEFLVRLVFHYRDLERLDLIDCVTGEPLLRIGDRLDALYSPCGTKLIRRFTNPPGLFITGLQDSGMGLGAKRNLLIATVMPRDQGVGT